MLSREQTLKFSTFLALFCTSTLILFLTAPTPTNGGLLSAYINHNRNFHYVVQRVPDNSINEIATNGSSSSSEEEEEGTATLSASSSFSNSSSKSSLLRMHSSYKDCGSSASISKLIVGPCVKSGKSDICNIKRGSTITFNLSFVPKSNATQLKAVIHGIIDFVPVPFPCPEPDACKNSGIVCPVQAGKQYDYTLSAPVKESYPAMKLWVKGELRDENAKDVICTKVHIRLV